MATNNNNQLTEAPPSPLSAAALQQVQFTYGEIRKEILQHDASKNQALGFAMTANGAIVALMDKVATNRLGPLLLLLSFANLAILRHLADRVNIVCMAGAYLERLEGYMPYVRWERGLVMLLHKQSLWNFVKGQFLYVMLALFHTAALFYSIWFFLDSHPLRAIGSGAGALIGAAISGSIVRGIHQSTSKNRTEVYAVRWESLLPAPVLAQAEQPPMLSGDNTRTKLELPRAPSVEGGTEVLAPVDKDPESP